MKDLFSTKTMTKYLRISNNESFDTYVIISYNMIKDGLATSNTARNHLTEA